jgi:cytochrome c553
MNLLAKWKAFAFLGAALWAPLFCGAQPTPARALACNACHGPNGNSQIKDIPSIAGQPKIFIENQLVLIREGMRDIPQMKGVLENVPDSELTALAIHYEGLPVVKPSANRQINLFTKGETLAKEMRCGICHLPNYVGREQMPRLAGQREDYLLHTMRSMKANQAVGRDSIMIASLYGISDEDLQAISHYLASLAP